ncbi:hypothetical protein L6164_008601 [Bauhinia variegata]|uniref:Uncharacterized protein n=1 Tax=Bauhinia variegata TaxID=167791 RepID=A0ACB9PID8_BAUVA|nr:hypothetical protein L6164_008601 [Bauhinia variegata]
MFPGSNNSGPSQTSSTHWTWHKNKPFEQALEVVPEDSPNRWENITEQVPGKSPEDIKERYDALVQDVRMIDLGLLKLPNYADDVAASPEEVCDSASVNQSSSGSRPTSSTAVTKRKVALWTVEEHKQFLKGLEKYGRGDWRRISIDFVMTKTPAQVASHAQGYFERQDPANNKGRRRASINDITTVDTKVVAPAVRRREDLFRRKLANNERTVVSLANDQDPSSEGSNSTVEAPPDHFPEQMGGNGDGN